MVIKVAHIIATNHHISKTFTVLHSIIALRATAFLTTQSVIGKWRSDWHYARQSGGGGGDGHHRGILHAHRKVPIDDNSDHTVALLRGVVQTVTVCIGPTARALCPVSFTIRIMVIKVAHIIATNHHISKTFTVLHSIIALRATAFLTTQSVIGKC